MSGAVSDPNSLTKDKLKRELLKHDVTLPPGDARKDVYVGLYREHVLGERVRLELFSSDDEGVSNSASKQRQPQVIPSSPKSVIHQHASDSHSAQPADKRPGSPRKSPVKKPALKKSSPVIASHKPVTMDVYSLTDEELLDELRKYNVQCGPILDSTRRIYQKKLIKVLSGGAAEPSSTADTLDVDDVDYSDQESEPEPEPEPAPVPRKTRTVERREIETREVRQRVTRQPAPPPEEYERATREEPPRTTYTSSTRSSTTTYRGASAAGPVSADDLVTQATPDPAGTSDPTQKGGLSIWVQLIIVLIVALIIFLVFQNMESASKGPTRQLGAESEV